mmetsp:Transcript_57089/g.112684  ORF Transcript_57089/g.112684 Transcript_57089/m.112684 type:complete len:211 (+) Transcript_57089:667-1299(+)
MIWIPPPPPNASPPNGATGSSSRALDCASSSCAPVATPRGTCPPELSAVAVECSERCSEIIEECESSLRREESGTGAKDVLEKTSFSWRRVSDPPAAPLATGPGPSPPPPPLPLLTEEQAVVCSSLYEPPIEPQCCGSVSRQITRSKHARCPFHTLATKSEKSLARSYFAAAASPRLAWWGFACLNFLVPHSGKRSGYWLRSGVQCIAKL